MNGPAFATRFLASPSKPAFGGHLRVTETGTSVSPIS
jgi:hypothetical protein